EASRISSLHSAVVVLALQRTLESIPDPPPKDLQALLEALKELLIARGECLTLPKTKDALAHFKTSGKTAKVVREILALTANTNAAPDASSAARALSGRLQRSERWGR